MVIFLTFDAFFLFFYFIFSCNKVLAGSAEFRALNTPDKDHPEEIKEVSKLYRQLYRVRTHVFGVVKNGFYFVHVLVVVDEGDAGRKRESGVRLSGAGSGR